MNQMVAGVETGLSAMTTGGRDLMISSTIPVRGQIGVTATRRTNESWPAVHRRAANELLEISRRRGAVRLVGLAPAWMVGDKLRITAHASYK